MPQGDLETLVTASHGVGASDRRIACETLADGKDIEDHPAENETIIVDCATTDFPPESFWLPKDAEQDWFDRNAFYERKESTRGNNSTSNNSGNLNRSASCTSQRYSVNLKSKASIIGLPKTQKATFVDSKRRTCKLANTKLFPNRTGSSGKSTMVEPGSPIVSCMGRVKSKRRRRRSNSIKKTEKPVEKLRTGREKQKTGLYSKVMSMFRSNKGKKKSSRPGSKKVVEEEQVVNVKVGEFPDPVSEPPGLGGINRYVSGRRTETWTADFNQGWLE